MYARHQSPYEKMRLIHGRRSLIQIRYEIIGCCGQRIRPVLLRGRHQFRVRHISSSYLNKKWSMCHMPNLAFAQFRHVTGSVPAWRYISGPSLSSHTKWLELAGLENNQLNSNNNSLVDYSLIGPRLGNLKFVDFDKGVSVVLMHSLRAREVCLPQAAISRLRVQRSRNWMLQIL
jgi:hypothetical protein